MKQFRQILCLLFMLCLNWGKVACHNSVMEQSPLNITLALKLTHFHKISCCPDPLFYPLLVEICYSFAYALFLLEHGFQSTMVSDGTTL